ncbi:MAG: sigma 54-interacting transcriptional regulator, partial [Kofleriaceae bacterium]
MTTDAALVFLAKVLAAIANAHSTKSLAREVASVFEANGIAIGPLSDVRELMPRLREVSELPAYFASAAFRDALAQVIETAVRQIETIERLAAVSRQSFAKRKELREALARAEHGHGIVARSAAMQAVMARVQLVARHATTVLITGESGTGKELVAREVHRLSPRAHRPYLQLNCGAIPSELVESELFGHERGAFTGAERAHAGIFERANGGTLLLDELGDLPLAAQTKLLRVMQERTVRRVGGTQEIALDVRVIAATHRDLRGESFREDLYYRLAVFQIEVPPLRDRREDIAPLAAGLIGELSRDPVPLSARDLAVLETYDWPGNVRELRNVLETMLVI